MGWYGDFFFDLAGYIPITLQGLLIPIYIYVLIKEKDFNVFNRYIAPVLALLGSLFLVYAVISTHGVSVLYYLAVFILIMSVGLAMYLKKIRKKD
ncbi:MAG: hypothetical protein FWC79_02020 [Oscillospiraceae bacterium]|nr:hypothetical protein [Oscillospiraceae bacterium]